MRLIVMTVLGAALLAQPAAAFERLEGYFIALEACEAFQSKNDRTNPGDVRTEPFHAYAMVGINAPGGDFFQMTVPGAPVVADRWVQVSCGVHVVEAGTPVADGPAGPIARPGTRESEVNLLALSWQPAFCETRRDKAECRDLNAGNLPATERQLSIHGLWPQPDGKFYCGVADSLVALDEASRWSDLPDPGVDADTRARLGVAMPGTASFLDRHEWIKHGTCHGGGADEYFDDTLRVVELVNGSEVGAFLAENVGAEVRTSDLRDRFDAAFGEGAGDRVEVVCLRDGGRTLIQELRINLRGIIGPASPLSELMQAADAISAGCAKGVIDPAGLQ